MFCFWPLNNSVEFARVLWLDRDVLEREYSHLRFSSVAFSVASLLDRQASRLPLGCLSVAFTAPGRLGTSRTSSKFSRSFPCEAPDQPGLIRFSCSSLFFIFLPYSPLFGGLIISVFLASHSFGPYVARRVCRG